MALVLAVILGVFWICRISVDKTSAKNARQEYENQREEYYAAKHLWETQVIDKSLEAELEDKIHERDENIIEELNETWPYFFYCEAPKGYIIGDSFFMSDNREYADTGIALRVLMANRGKLYSKDAEYGIKIFVDTSYNVTHNQAIVKYRELERFILKIDEKLKTYGVDYPIYWGRDNHGNTFLPFPLEHITIVNKEQIPFGVVLWRPALPFLSQHSYGSEQ